MLCNFSIVNMALLSSATSLLSKIVCTGPTLTGYGLQQVRNKWTKWKTMRDMRNRKTVKEFAPTRLRYLAMKRNDVLPVELKDLASKAFEEIIPRQASTRLLVNRCVVTSRGFGVVRRWRVSRFIFRHLVDYNKMAGVQRAIW